MGTLTPGIYAGSATVVGSNFYVGGGVLTSFEEPSVRFLNSASFSRFNATTRSVVSLSDMPGGLTRGALVAHPNGRLYWIGGYFGSTETPTARVWAYLPTLDQWWQ